MFCTDLSFTNSSTLKVCDVGDDVPDPFSKTPFLVFMKNTEIYNSLIYVVVI